jgi:surfeit locus 1 family protein
VNGEAGERARYPRSPLTLALLGLCAVAGVAGLTALGVWQLERRVWKLDLIAKVDERVHAVPVALPAPSAWPAINADDDEYRRVTTSGHFLHDRETLVQAVTERGSGVWVLTPLQTDAGFAVLVNRGFVPADKRDAAMREQGQVAGETSVTGLMRMTEPHGAFLRANDAATDRWYSRDVVAIAAARGITNVAPYFIDADATPNPGGLPIGGLTVIAFRNTHLVYALTWFALALMLAGLAVRIALEELRVHQSSQASNATPRAG